MRALADRAWIAGSRAELRLMLTKGPNRMFWLKLAMLWRRLPARPVPAPRAFARGRKAAAAHPPGRAPRRPGMRRGLMMVLPAPWRRADIGRNHITAFGVWRAGSRRAAPRVNRCGETRWQRPFRQPQRCHHAS